MKKELFGELCVIGMRGCEEFVSQVNNYLREWRKSAPAETFLVDHACPRFGSGESLLDVAKQLKEKGAKRIFNFATFGLFTSGFDKFDKAYEDGIIDKIFTTNLVYHTPELHNKKWWSEVNMCKFVAFLIETLNHDDTISNLLDPVEKINSVLKKYGQR